MNTFLARSSAMAVVAGLCVALSAGCAVEGGGYGYDNRGPGFAGDYYEPYGGSYGGWGGAYQVGPVRGGENRSYGGGEHQSYRGGEPYHGGGGGSASHAYRSAPASRPAPSIPSGSHSGRSERH